MLANPPYVAERERAALAPEIVRHEPRGALFAGRRRARRDPRAARAARSSRRGCALVALEIGAGQAPAVAELMRAAGFRDVRAERDLAGIERVIVGERPSERGTR